jgi:hypothetical protein
MVILRLFAALGGIVGYVLAALFTVYPATKPEQQHFYFLLAVIFGALAFILLAAVEIWADLRRRSREQKDAERERKRKKRERKRDKRVAALQDDIKELLTLRVQPPVPTGPGDTLKTEVIQSLPAQGAVAHKYLREAGFALAKEMRDFLDSVPDGLPLEEEHNLVFQPFLQTFWPRLRDIKDRFAVHLGPNEMVSSVQWLPTTKERIRLTEKHLEREAEKIKPDVLT